MKKLLVTTSIALAIGAASNHTLAASDIYQYDSGEINTAKEGVAFGSTAIIGGLVAGPVGAVIGAVGGAFLGKELTKADDYNLAKQDLKEKEVELAGVNTEITALKNQLAVLQDHNEQIENLAVNDLEFHLLFHTGNDTLNEEAMTRLDSLADFLKKNPELSVRLHGHADPRGSDGYNNVLSQHRALNVQNALEFYGVETERLERYSYGANKSTAIKGDLDAYALERKVTVQIINESTQDEFAIVD